ncbi:hypothetical protein IC757_12845 [Wenzhouxiangella sp. AB-CW3]|uniref:ABC transporter substrate-binding protein n=1 Tax=Wenzhouxiangella sp. AB-CW3 TaxID=2771012 RepID=UPI00168ABC2F|nr:ABC transporter substrate-binding protein [Wenzhouxiangella sp. AB-CW3]QOC21909.1 hypothetical protein IC757_12845 [Wenzhouxiangella sp. AB-CW3]
MSTSTRLVCAVLATLAFTAACNKTDTNAADETTYRHAIDGVPASLDPAHAADVYSSTLVVNLFDTLYRYRYLERPYQLAPNLAADMPEVSDDGLVWTIRMREDAVFAPDPAFPDGTGRRVTAADVVYSLARHFDPATRSQGAWLWRDRILGLDQWVESGADPDQPIEGLQALDEHTLQITLKRPFPQLAHTLAMALSAVVPREVVESRGREFGTHPVGSGPFTLARRDESQAVLLRRPDFVRDPFDLAYEGHDPELHAELELEHLDGRHYPFVDRLEIHFITEPGSRWSSFAAGEVDNVMVPPDQATRILSSRDPIRFTPEISQQYHSMASPEAGFVLYGFNMANQDIGHHPEPTRDQANRQLRCAMRDAFDWDRYNETFHHGLAQVFPGAIPPFVEAFDPSHGEDSIRHQPERAREHMDELAATEQLPRLTYGMEASVHQRQMFEQFRQRMVEAGLPRDHMQSRAFASFGEYSRAIAAGELDIFLLGWTMAWPDAQYALQLFYGPNAAPGANSFSYRNPEFDALFERATALPDGPERTALYRQLNDIVMDDCVFIGSLARTRLHLWHRHAHMQPDREMLGGFFLRFVDVGARP